MPAIHTESRIELELPTRATARRFPANTVMPGLPMDYFCLTRIGKRHARVNAISLQETPADLLRAYLFFQEFYLNREEALFFEGYRPTPPWMLQVIYDIAAERLNAIAAPRGAGKSVMLRVLQMLLLLTRKGYRIGGVFSVQTKARDSGEKMKDQLEYNPYIIRDFGTLSTKRGRRAWSNTKFVLARPLGSSFESTWMDGAGRGLHCDFLPIDDVEIDPSTDDVSPAYSKKLSMVVRKKYMPMVEIASTNTDTEANERGLGILLIGTIIRQDMFLNHLIDSPDDGDWGMWNRRLLEAETDTGLVLDPGRHDAKTLELLRRVMGDAFDSEFRNRPGASLKGTLPFDDELHTYTKSSEDAHWPIAPYQSSTVLTRKYPNPNISEAITVPLIEESITARELLSGMDIAILIDPANMLRESRVGNDSTCIHVVGNDHTHTIWSLDLWLGKDELNTVSDHLLSMVFKWRPNKILMEECGFYTVVCGLLWQHAKSRILAACGYLPAIQPVTFNKRVGHDKGTRIMGSLWRFQNYKIVIPWEPRVTHPYSELYYQIRHFTPGLERLRHDDAIDTFSLLPSAFAGPGDNPSQWLPQFDGLPIIESIRQGRLYSDRGVYLPPLLGLHELTPEIESIIAQHESSVRSTRGDLRNAGPTTKNPFAQSSGSGPRILDGRTHAASPIR